MPGMGMGGKPAENATFLNTQDNRHNTQFLSGVATHASAELLGPTDSMLIQAAAQISQSEQSRKLGM